MRARRARSAESPSRRRGAPADGQRGGPRLRSPWRCGRRRSGGGRCRSSPPRMAPAAAAPRTRAAPPPPLPVGRRPLRLLGLSTHLAPRSRMLAQTYPVARAGRGLAWAALLFFALPPRSPSAGRAGPPRPHAAAGRRRRGEPSGALNSVSKFAPFPARLLPRSPLIRVDCTARVCPVPVGSEAGEAGGASRPLFRRAALCMSSPTCRPCLARSAHPYPPPPRAPGRRTGQRALRRLLSGLLADRTQPETATNRARNI